MNQTSYSEFNLAPKTPPKKQKSKNKKNILVKKFDKK